MLLEAIVLGLLAFATSFVVIMAAEKFIHRLTRNPFRVYRWGVWLFSILVGGWMFLTSLGR